jgi:hypothetical protein
MRTITLFALLTLLAGCNLGPTSPRPTLSPDTVGASQVVDDLGPWPADPFQSVRVRIEGDTLVADVTYGGGCEEHRFALVFASEFMESEPVQVRGLLSHDARGDMCRALLGRTLRYDLTPLRRAYEAAYRTESGVIDLQGNWPEAMRYRF